MNIVLWVLQILLALLFMFTGVSKCLMSADDMAKDMPSFLSIGFIYFIGVCEILGSIGLVVPWLTKIKPMLTPLAAAGLVIITVGATFVTAIGNVPLAIVPATTGVLSAIVAWGRKGGRSN